MLELYVLLTLGGLGYILNQTNNNITHESNTISLNEIPSMNNIYESTHFKDTDEKVRKKAAVKFQESQNPIKSNTISYNHGIIMENIEKNKENEKVLSLSGEYIDFDHNNMTPFYGGSVKQNMNDNANRTILENYTGISDLQKNKCESTKFFNPVKNTTYINGAPSQTDLLKDRIVLPTKHNNQFPIAPVNVGPGIGQGYSSKPIGGFQQSEIRDFIIPKNVDQLRVKNNEKNDFIGSSDTQKQTYDGRILDGIKNKLPGLSGKVEKNRPERYYKQSQDMLIKTTGANLKPAQFGDWDVKETNRLTTSRDQIGPAFGKTQLAEPSKLIYKKTARQQFDSNYIGVAKNNYGKADKDDYGKSKILVYTNERDVTSTRVYQGNVISLVKSLIAPIEDMIKITKKQHHVDNPRHFGNLKGNDKMTIYDPNDVARTTIKETIIQDTMGTGIISGTKKNYVYDPNDIARTTIKETILQDTMGNGTITGSKQLYVYDPDEVARKTTRETIENYENVINMAPTGGSKGIVYDPNFKAKTTTKETIVDLQREYGNIDAKAHGGGYETNKYDAKLTQKQFMSDNDYYGTATKERGGGYETNEYNAKTTQKEFMSDNDYYGIAGAGQDAKPISYEEYLNATINLNKEEVLIQRDPTQTGVKNFNDCINVAEPKKFKCKEIPIINKDRVYNEISSFDEIEVTKDRKNVDYQKINNRLDSSLLDAFKSNPYTQSLSSYI